MDFKHVIVAIVFILIGYWIGTKYPGVIGKTASSVTGG